MNRSRTVATVAALAFAATLTPSIVGAGGPGGWCATPEVQLGSSDDEIIVYDTTIDIYDDRGRFVRTEPLNPARQFISVGTGSGDDVIDLRSTRVAHVCSGTGDDVLIGRTSPFSVYAEGDLTAQAGIGSGLQDFHVADDAHIESFGSAFITVLGDAFVRTGAGEDYIQVLGDADVDAGGGRDIILTHDGDDVINGGPGDDYIRSGTGSDEIDGGPGYDNCDDFRASAGRRDTYLNCEIRTYDPAVFKPEPTLPSPLPSQDLAGALGF